VWDGPSFVEIRVLNLGESAKELGISHSPLPSLYPAFPVPVVVLVAGRQECIRQFPSAGSLRIGVTETSYQLVITVSRQPRDKIKNKHYFVHASVNWVEVG
jgi:hypothetical protein